MTNKEIVIKALHDAGITNPYSIAGIMSIIQKESGFIPQREKPYTNTSNARIREIFYAARTLDEAALSAIKKDPVKFFNLVYGGRYGNAMNEGYKYRGGGFNQLTFKANYAKYGKMTGTDLVNNPDLINAPALAARVVALFMKEQFANNPTTVKKRYGASDINDFKDTTTAVQAFYNANAGFGKDTRDTTTSGKTEALSSVDKLYTSVTSFLSTGEGKLLSFSTLVLIGLGIYLIKN